MAAQVINLAAQGVGGVYGAVKSAENGNGVGLLAGALEAAAAAATGIGMLPGQATQTLNLISTALGAASVATNMGSDFASGNLAQGLLDSLNLYLPAVALANATDQTNQSNLQMNSAAFAAGGANPAPNVNIPNFSDTVAAAENAPTPSTSGTGSSGVTVTVAPVGAGGVANVDSTIGSGTGAVVTQRGQTYVVAATPTSSGDTVQATLSGIAADVMSFLGYINPIGTAEAAGPTPDTSQEQQARFSAAAQAFAGAKVPYLVGGTTTAGADCSGSIDAIYAAAGINIGHMLSGNFPNSPLFAPVVGAPEVGDIGWQQGHVVMWGGNLGTNAQGQQLSIWSATHTGGPTFGAFTANTFGAVTYYRYIGH